MKPLILAVVLGIASVQPSRSALPLAPIAVVVGAGATVSAGSEGWTDLGALTVGMNSEFPQITIEADLTEPQRFYRVRVELLPATKGGA